MAEIKKIATRESYGNALKELASEGADKLVVLDADLSAATKTGIFKKAYPDRHFNCGIAESNMMCVAAGLSTMGLVPFASSFAMFAAGRAFEQVRNTIGYPHLNVKIGATHAGISVGEDGASHQCCEDFALMRSIPGMVVICPADDIEARQAVKAAYKYEGPVYLRFGRLAVPVFHSEDYKFEIGKGEVIKEGSDVSIIANGLMVNEAIEAGKALEAKGVRCEIDDRSEKIGFKIRQAQLEKVPYMLLAGDKDIENNTVSLRTRSGGDKGAMSLDEFVDKLLKEVDDKSLELTM